VRSAPAGRRGLLPPLLTLLALLAFASAAGAQTLSDTLTPQREIDLGRQLAHEIEQTIPLTSDKAMETRVERIGAAVVEQLQPKVYPYQFRVLAKPEVNAFALPGGFIYFYEGLVAVTPSDDALAFVVAHEVAHVSHRHAAKRLERLKGPAFLGQLVGSLTLVGGLLANLAVSLTAASYSRQDENDADATAVEFMWQAGFDTAGADTVMQKFMTLEKGKGAPRFLRGHPPSDHRLGWIGKKRKELASRSLKPAEAAPEPAVDLSQLVGKLPEAPLAESTWFPLQVGDEWTYSVETQQAKGARASYTIAIMGCVPVPGGAVYRAQVTFGKTVTSYQLLTTHDGVWKRPSAASGSPAWQFEYATDFASDQSIGQDGWRYSVQGVEPVSTACGTFPQARKIRKEASVGGAVFEAWFVEGIGLVKRINASAGVTETLTSYRLAPLAPPRETPTEAATPAEPVPAEKAP